MPVFCIVDWDCNYNILFFLDKTFIMKYYLNALIYLFTQLYNTSVYGSNGKLSSYRKGNFCFFSVNL